MTDLVRQMPEPPYCNASGMAELERLRKVEAEMVCIRAILQLEPWHDAAESVRVLHDDGRGEFERLRRSCCGK